MFAIDANVIVHYLTDDHPEKAPRARAIIDGAPVFVPVTVILETEWVLRSAYAYGRTDVVHALRAFGGLPTVAIEDADTVAGALDLATLGMDFADALHLGGSGHCDGFVTFDRRLTKTAADAGHTAVRDA